MYPQTNRAASPPPPACRGLKSRDLTLERIAEVWDVATAPLPLVIWCGIEMVFAAGPGHKPRNRDHRRCNSEASIACNEHHAPAGKPGTKAWNLCRFRRRFQKTNFGLKEEASFGHGADDFLGFVRKGLSDLGNALGDGFVGYRHVTPNRLQQLFASYQSAVVLSQVPHHLERFRAEFDLVGPAEQALGGSV